MNIEVLGHRVLVKVDNVEKKSKGGIVLVMEGQESSYQQAMCTGTIEGIGAQSWKELGDGTPWCQVGDRVYFQKYGGIQTKEDDTDYRILNDEDILAIKRS